MITKLKIVGFRRMANRILKQTPDARHTLLGWVHLHSKDPTNRFLANELWKGGCDVSHRYNCTRFARDSHRGGA